MLALELEEVLLRERLESNLLEIRKQRKRRLDEEFKAVVDFVEGLPLSDEDKDKILGGNAEKYILKKQEAMEK